MKDCRFVYAKRTIKISNTVSVEKGDVGVIDNVNDVEVYVFFIRVWKKIKLKYSDYAVFNVNETGDGFSNKICNMCHKLKKTTMFAKNQNAKNNRSVRRPSCRDCRREMEGVNISIKDKKEWAKNKPEKEPFQCPICSKRTIAGVTSKIVLEHDHKTGEVRGWICDSCNTGLGRFKDNKALLLRAIKFIE